MSFVVNNCYLYEVSQSDVIQQFKILQMFLCEIFTKIAKLQEIGAQTLLPFFLFACNHEEKILVSMLHVFTFAVEFGCLFTKSTFSNSMYSYL